MSGEAYNNTNSPTPGFGGREQSNRNNQTGQYFSNGEQLIEQAATAVVDQKSNLGSAVPLTVPTARTLFYRGGFYENGSDKYGQFLFYSLHESNGNDFIDRYYKSERSEYNSGITSTASKNPSAGSLVGASMEQENALKQAAGNEADPNTDNPIIGGASAPYTWADFLYCKYYGSIPNNYMLTLRRFPAPMRDNLSLPDGVIQSDFYKAEGAGRPVAQAVTWWGGATDNSLNSIIGFASGLKWNSKTQAEVQTQEGFDQGFFKSVLGRAFSGTATSAGAGDLLSVLGDTANLAIQATDAGREQVTTPKINFALRDKMTRPEGGPLSDFIFTSVDTVDKTWIRGRGLTFGDKSIELKFHYELTSVSEINTKAAMLDIIGNCLGLGTNYGNYLTPDIRYDNKFPAIGFPGGEDGLKRFYSDPLGWTKTAIKFLADPSGTTMNNPDFEALQETQNQVDKAVQDLNSVIQQLSTQDLAQVAAELDDNSAVGNILAAALADDLIEQVRLPLSLYTGAPVGEWHLVVGNPMNPIAMIGNLICENVSVEFGEVLGPDDFPTEIVATYTLKHGRDRERGEIESMFNRGKIRLYQSSIPTYSNSQSLNSLGTSDGSPIVVDPNDTTSINPSEQLTQQSGFTAN